jgi:hypothetical protein
MKSIMLSNTNELIPCSSEEFMGKPFKSLFVCPYDIRQSVEKSRVIQKKPLNTRMRSI